MILRPTALRYDPPRSVIAVRDRLIAETCDRAALASSAISTTSGVLYLSAIPLFAGQVISGITVCTGSLGATGPTNWWFALYDRNLALLGQSADQLTTAIASNTAYALSLVSPYIVPVTESYYLGIMFATSVTNPNFRGASSFSAAVSAVSVPLFGASTTGLTTTPPNPADAITPSTSGFWGAVT